MSETAEAAGILLAKTEMLAVPCQAGCATTPKTRQRKRKTQGQSELREGRTRLHMAPAKRSVVYSFRIAGKLVVGLRLLRESSYQGESCQGRHSTARIPDGYLQGTGSVQW